MSSIYESFYANVAANSTITDELASANAVYPEILPQSHDGFPAITFSLLGDRDIDMLGGGRNELSFGVIEVNVWGGNAEIVHDISTILKNELIGYRGTFGSHTAEQIRKTNEFSVPPEPDTGLYRIALEFTIAYH